MLNYLTKESIHGFYFHFTSSFCHITPSNVITCINHLVPQKLLNCESNIFLILLKQLTALFKSIRLIYMYVLATKDVPCYC